MVKYVIQKIKYIVREYEYLFAGLFGVFIFVLASIVSWVMIDSVEGLLFAFVVAITFFLPSGLLLENIGYDISNGSNLVVVGSAFLFWIFFSFFAGIITYRLYRLYKK